MSSNKQEKAETASAVLAEVYLTEDEVAVRYRRSKRTLQRWRLTGIGGPPFVRMGLRCIAYRLSECEAWAAGRTYKSCADEMARKAA